MRRYILLISLLLIFGCAEKSKIKTVSTEEIKIYNSHTEKRFYTIKPGDRISVLFYRHPELSTKNSKGVLVSKEGFITLPLIGSIKVAGLSEKGTKTLLEKKYSKYIKDPHLYIEVLNKKIYVVGEVKKPGAIYLDSNRISLIEALSMAGDITDFGKRREIYILRGGLKNPEVIVVNIGKPEMLFAARLMLQPDDIVYVPEKRIKNINLAINGVLPLVNLVGGILSSFVDIKYLSQ